MNQNWNNSLSPLDNEMARTADGEHYMRNDVTIQWIYHNWHDDQVRTSAHNFKINFGIVDLEACPTVKPT